MMWYADVVSNEFFWDGNEATLNQGDHGDHGRGNKVEDTWTPETAVRSEIVSEAGSMKAWKVGPHEDEKRIDQAQALLNG